MIVDPPFQNPRLVKLDKCVDQHFRGAVKTLVKGSEVADPREQGSMGFLDAKLGDQVPVDHVVMMT